MYDLSKYKVESLEYILDDRQEPQAARAAVEEADWGYAGITDVIDENSYTTTNPKVVSTGTHTRLAVWLNTETADVNDVQLYYSYYNGNGWSAPAKISDDGTFDYAPKVCAVNGKSYVIWQNAEQRFDEDVLESETVAEQLAAHMGGFVRMNYRPCASLAVDGCYYEKSEIGAGCTLPITVEVTNTGMADFYGVKVEVLDTEGASVYSTELRETVGTGKTAGLKFGYIVNKKDLGKTYTVKCTPLSEDGEDVYGGDALLELSYEDLELTFANWGLKDDKTAVILAQAANAGFSPLSDVAATLYKVEGKEGDGAEGEIIKQRLPGLSQAV
jgi:hypothetical protein